MCGKPNADGWGTALKPAWEPIIVARKPLDGTVAANVLKWGTGAVNVDGCRVGTDGRPSIVADYKDTNNNAYAGRMNGSLAGGSKNNGTTTLGRWPANFIHDGSDEVVAGFPETAKGTASGYNWQESNNDNPSHVIKNIKSGVHFGDSGSAARFFYCAKASKRDRDEGCEGLEESACGMMEDDNYPIKTGSGNLRDTTRRNTHPTVKPTDLMRYLCRLVTPPGGVVLDPFMGSGSTGKAAVLEGFRFIGIDLSAEYVEIARARIAHAQHDGAALFAGAVP